MEVLFLIFGVFVADRRVRCLHSYPNAELVLMIPIPKKYHQSMFCRLRCNKTQLGYLHDHILGVFFLKRKKKKEAEKKVRD